MSTQQQTREQRHSSEQHSGEQRFGELRRFWYKRASLGFLAVLLAFGCLGLSACAKSGPSEKELAEQRAAKSYQKIAEAQKQKQEEIDKNNADPTKPKKPWAIPRQRKEDETIPKELQINDPPPEQYEGYTDFTPEGANNTAAYYYDALYYALKTGELKHYNSVTSTQCKVCDIMRKTVENFRSAGYPREVAYPEYRVINDWVGQDEDADKIQVDMQVKFYPVFLRLNDNEILGKLDGGELKTTLIISTENGHNVVIDEGISDVAN